MKSQIAIALLCATLAIVSVNADPIQYKYQNWTLFNTYPSSVSVFNQTIVTEQSYAYNMSSKQYYTIYTASNLNCTSTYQIGADGSAFCQASNSNSVYYKLTLAPATVSNKTQIQWTSLQMFSTSSVTFTQTSNFANGSYYNLVSTNSYTCKLLTFNVTNNGTYKTYENINYTSPNSSSPSLSSVIAMNSKGFAISTVDEDGKNFANAYFYTDFNKTNTTYLGTAFVYYQNYSTPTAVQTMLFNNSMALVQILTYSSDTNSSYYFRINSVAWTSTNTTKVQSLDFLRNYTYDLGSNAIQLNDTHFAFIAPVLDTKGKIASRVINLYTVNPTDGSLYKAGSVPFIIYNPSRSNMILKNWVLDGMGNLLLFGNMAQANINVNGWFYNGIYQYQTQMVSAPIYIGNGTSISASRYGLGQFDHKTGKMTNWLGFYADSMYYDWFSQGLFFIQQSTTSCQILAINATTSASSVYTYENISCSCYYSSDRAFIQSASIAQAGNKPSFTYVCASTPLGDGDVITFLNQGTSQNKYTVYKRNYNDLLFINYGSKNITSIQTYANDFDIYEYGIPGTGGKSVGSLNTTAEQVAKIDENLVLVASQATGSVNSVVSIIRLSDMKYVFNETVAKPSLTKLIPLGYNAKSTTRIDGFLFIDAQDYSLWFYNVQEKGKLVQTGFAQANAGFSQVGNGTVVYNISSGPQGINYYNITDFGLGASILSTASILSLLLALMMIVF